VPTFVKTLLLLLAGTAVGLCVTLVTLERGVDFNAIKAGPWVAFPKNGTADSDPYSRAILMRSGEIPLATSEGLSFIARRDSAGAPFTPGCDYNLQGQIPQARYWTLTLLSPKGFLIDTGTGNGADYGIESGEERHGFTSTEILRNNNGDFVITLSRHARPGNWLPLGQSSFVLLLRLYDTELGAMTSALNDRNMPKVVKGGCT
jgi:hypothetical protein